ncbi:MAG TPA: DUF1801 domain-containing protein [Terriglobales bacterium]|jgi:uncharacterized protein YdhG (YjbR/CyaY superfamily)
MNAKQVRPKTVDEFIKATPKEAQSKLRQMRAAIRACAPGAVEGLRYGLPAFSYKRILVVYGAHSQHIGFYPTPSAVSAFKKELSKYKTAKGSIQFPLNEPLPLPLVRKITEFRVRESLEKDGKWKTGMKGKK